MACWLRQKALTHPFGILVDLNEAPDGMENALPDPDEPDLANLFEESDPPAPAEEEPILDPTAQPFFPKRSRKAPKRFGHNVGYY